ncbi:MAG: hypothetical protein R3F05_16530 [Planctomycetota bacterium]
MVEFLLGRYCASTDPAEIEEKPVHRGATGSGPNGRDGHRRGSSSPRRARRARSG